MPLVERQLANGSAFAEGWFARGEAASLLAEHRAGTRDPIYQHQQLLGSRVAGVAHESTAPNR